MKNLLLYIVPILLALYIISPIDAHPLFLDDLIAFVVFLYLIYKRKGIRRQQQRHTHSHKEGINIDEVITVDDAYRILGVAPDASWEEIKKAYKEKIAKNHPDKVNHLSNELQDKAKELTLKLNTAFEIVKKYKNMN